MKRSMLLLALSIAAVDPIFAAGPVDVALAGTWKQEWAGSQPGGYNR